MRSFNIALRVLRYVIFGALAFVAGALLVFTVTEQGRDNLSGLISRLASTPERRITVGGIDGIWSGKLKIDHLLLQDREGPWLALRGVEIDWSPLALLSRRFEAERIRAERVEFARLPHGAPQDTQDSGSGGLPVALDIRRIELPEIALGAALAGGIAEISLNGSLQADAALSSVDSDFQAERTDGRGGSLGGHVAYHLDRNQLEVDISGSEPADGILANFLKLPGAPPVAIAAKGSGPLADWTGEASFSVNGAVLARLSGTHRHEGTDHRFTARGEGEFMRFLPASVQPLLEGRTVFDLAGLYRATGALAIERGTLESNTLSADIQGSYDPQGSSNLSVDARATGAPVGLSFGQEPSPVTLAVQSLKLRVSGEGAAPAVDVDAALASLGASGYGLGATTLKLHSDALDLNERSGPFSLSIDAGSATAGNETVAKLLAGALSLEAVGAVSGDRITLERASLNGGALNANVSGSAATAGTFSLDLAGSVASNVLPQAARQPLDDRVAFQGRVSRNEIGALDLSGMTVKSGSLEATGQAALNEGAIAAQVEGTLSDLARLNPGAAGQLAFSLRASGQQNAPDLALTLSSDRIDAAGQSITGLELSAQGKADVAAPQAEVSLQGNVGGQALQGTARLSTNEGRREIAGLNVGLGPNRITGDLVLDQAFVPTGTLRLDLPELAPLAALALQSVQGAASGNVRFTREGGQPRVDVDLSAPNVRRDALNVSDAQVRIAADNYLAAPALSGTIRAARVVNGGTHLRDVDVTLTRDGSWTGFSGSLNANDIPVTAAGRVQFSGGQVTVELASGSANVRGVRATVGRSTTVVIRDGQVRLDRFALAVGGGSAEVSGTAGGDLDLNVALSRVPASVANAFAAGLDAAGTISGTARVTGAAANPAVGFDADWSGAEIAQTRAAGFGALNIAADGQFAAGRVRLNMTAADAAGLSLRGSGSVETTGARNLDINVSGNVPFSFLTRRLAEQGVALTGGADLSIAVRGAAGAPVISGSVRSSGARFVDARSGIAINDINAEIAVGNGVARITRMTGQLSTDGTVTVSGTVGIEAASGFPADLSVKIADGRYSDGRVVTSNFNGDLTVKGPLTGAAVLGGRVDLGRTVITVPERLPRSLSSLNVQHRNAPADVRRQEDALQPAGGSNEGGGGGGLTLDLAIEAPQRIFVRGRGLDAELGGSLRLTGGLGAPEAVGRFTLRRGRLLLLSRRLNFTEGTLGFTGSLMPALNFVAEAPAEGATITVAVTGPANNPKFNFSSVPALPEDEVLARLLFGRSMSNLSPLQIVQLADAAAQLAGVGGSSPLLETLRGRLGVDDLEIRTDEKTGNTSVAVGRYLNDRTYLSVEGTGRARIDLNVGRGVKLRGEAGADGETKGGIFYEREY